MSDSPAWTPGPWAYDGITIRTIDPLETIDDRVLHSRSRFPFSQADAELIALAPEMAAAILAWDDDDDWTDGGPTDSRLHDIAVRLRRIGTV